MKFIFKINNYFQITKMIFYIHLIIFCYFKKYKEYSQGRSKNKFTQTRRKTMDVYHGALKLFIRKLIFEILI